MIKINLAVRDSFTRVLKLHWQVNFKEQDYPILDLAIKKWSQENYPGRKVQVMVYDSIIEKYDGEIQ
tara:strand:- start:59 stop:259 length:201 start_codon:yes stop_codon:yes gene_type:complete